jgi:hypothetical protein
MSVSVLTAVVLPVPPFWERTAIVAATVATIERSRRLWTGAPLSARCQPAVSR